MSPWQDPSTITHLKSSIRRHLGTFLQLRKFVDSDDVLQNVLIRLLAAAEKTNPPTQADLLKLAARHIRWELADLHRTYFGPEGPGKKVFPLSGTDVEVPTPPRDAHSAIVLAEAVERLEPESREVVDLLFYNELTHEQAAEVLGTTTKTIQRRWKAARVQLGRLVS